MFYGTISKDASIDTSRPFSNNFSVARGNNGNGSSGCYLITFDEYVHYLPSIVATASSNGTGNGAVSIEYSMTQATPTQSFQAQFVTTTMSGNQNDFGFSFHARTGQSLVFDASLNPTLTLVPQITTFNKKTQILTLSTSIKGLDEHTAQSGTSGTYTAYLDKGTVLLGVLDNGGSMTLSIQDSLEDPSGNTWTLTGWTFGADAGVDGKQWQDNAYPLSLGSGTRRGSPMTTPQSFVIMATHGDQTLTSDPIVRLSNVPPAGLSM